MRPAQACETESGEAVRRYTRTRPAAIGRWKMRAASGLLFLAAIVQPALAEEHLPAGTRIERPGLPVMVTGTGEMGAWIFSRSDVERIVVDEDDLERCRVDLRACRATVGKQEQHVEDAHAIVPWLVAGGVLAAFTGGVWVGVHAR